MPVGAEKYFDIEIGKSNLKICSLNFEKCLRARVVFMSGKFPGVPFSSFFLINYFPELDIVVSREQFLYIAEFIKGEKIDTIPFKTLYIKL